MTIIPSDDISTTIHYFENECTKEEFYWLGSILKTQSKELIQALHGCLARVTPKIYCQQNFKTEHM